MFIYAEEKNAPAVLRRDLLIISRLTFDGLTLFSLGYATHDTPRITELHEILITKHIVV